MGNVYLRINLIILFVAIGNCGFAQDQVPERQVPEHFCIESEKDFNKHKDFLPEYFKTLPVAMGTETKKLLSDVIVVLHIGFRGEALALTSDVWKFGKRYQDLQEIKKVCFNTKKKEMTIRFTTDADKIEVKYGDNEFTTQGVALKKLTPDQKKDYSEHIEKKDSEKRTGNGEGQQ